MKCYAMSQKCYGPSLLKGGGHFPEGEKQLVWNVPLFLQKELTLVEARVSPLCCKGANLF
jgi:hypothetical protein